MAELTLTLKLTPDSEELCKALVCVHTALLDDPDNEEMKRAATHLERAFANNGSSATKN